MSTIKLVFRSIGLNEVAKIEEWLRAVLWEYRLPHISETSPSVKDFSVHRTKGRVHVSGSGIKMIQGVREVFDIVELEGTRQEPLEAGSDSSKLVLIGRELDREAFQSSLDECLAQDMQ